jgi:hypothetical protein
VATFRDITLKLEDFASGVLHTRPNLVSALRWLVPALFVAVIGYHLYRIGLSRVWLSPPTSPAFYITLLLLPALLPAEDLLIYRYLWRVGNLPLLYVLLQKRYMNNLVLDYSGEAYFFLWARKNVKRPDDVIAHSIKDSNVLSAGAGLGANAIVLLVVIAVTGVRALRLNGVGFGSAVLGAAIPAILCLALVVGGRRLTVLSRTQMATVFLIHFARSAGALTLDFLLWWLSGALPSAFVCLEFVALRIIVSRLPVVPNKGLLFAGVAIAAAGYMNASTPRVTAVVIIMSAFEQLIGFVVVGVPWLMGRFGLRDRLARLTR